MKIPLIAMLGASLLFGCAHLDQEFHLAKTGSGANVTTTLCHGLPADDRRVKEELTVDGHCYRKACRDGRCAESGNQKLPGLYLHLVELGDPRKLVEPKFITAREQCRGGWGSVAACETFFVVAGRVDRERITDTLCQRKPQFTCTKTTLDLRKTKVRLRPLAGAPVYKIDRESSLVTFNNIVDKRTGKSLSISD